MLAFFFFSIDVVQNFPFFANDVHVVESDHSITPSIVLWSSGIIYSEYTTFGPSGKGFRHHTPYTPKNEKSIASHRNVIYTIE